MYFAIEQQQVDPRACFSRAGKRQAEWDLQGAEPCHPCPCARALANSMLLGGSQVSKSMPEPSHPHFGMYPWTLKETSRPWLHACHIPSRTERMTLQPSKPTMAKSCLQSQMLAQSFEHLGRNHNKRWNSTIQHRKLHWLKSMGMAWRVALLEWSTEPE